MQVQIREGAFSGGEQIACWNGDAIQAYADGVNAKEERLAASPDINVTPGTIACNGCVVNQWGNGTMCSAQLTETQFVVIGERSPRDEDAFGSMSEKVDGYEFVKPGSRKVIVESVEPVISEPTTPSRRRILSFLNR